MKFNLQSDYQPTGDQPQAIQQLTEGVKAERQHQTLLGVTGSGKTFTMANVIQNVQKPTLVIAHNKTLAAQLYQEFRDFFPKNAVSYFVSYYDYYQPEAYIPTTDTYIEKEAQINDEIDKLRLATTTNLLTREDVIVVASVSCIYNLGSPVEYGQYSFEMVEGELLPRQTLLLQLTNLQYERSDTQLERGSFRVRGDTIQLWPAYQDTALKIETLENKITAITEIDPISGVPITNLATDDENLRQSQTTRDHKGRFILYPAKHYMINPKTEQEAITEIRQDLTKRVKALKAAGKELEAYRLEKKVNYDLEMLREFGFVNGIENYSRYFDGRQPGQPPFTLLDYFAENVKRFDHDSFLTIIDESHMTVPQIRGMFAGDRSRKETLIKYGFRLPSALDNRPLRFTEFLRKTQQNLYVSATPKDWEIKQSDKKIVEQLIRPTGLLDPVVELRPTENQIQDLVIEIIKRVNQHQRVLVTTLTKRMAEDLTDYLNNQDKIDKLVNHHLAEKKERDEAKRNEANSSHLENRSATLSDNETVGSFQEKNSPQNTTATDSKNPASVKYLPVSQMQLGKIDQQYLSRARIQSSQLQSELTYPQVAYLHSEIETLERSDILEDLRRGKYDVIVGINLLREGLDLPEVSLVAILDADKAGFLRSETSLIQTMGRAARHQEGRAVLYADYLTEAMQSAINETQRRRQTQEEYNQQHKITPTTIVKPIRKRLLERKKGAASSNSTQQFEPTIIRVSKNETIDLSTVNPKALTPQDKQRLKKKLTRRMRQAAKDLDFELAAILRDKIREVG